jgi:putative transposase
MPRGPRLDAPGALHHVRVRGIERGLIFRDDDDRADFVSRMQKLTRSVGGPVVYAWSLLTNHAHLLVRSRQRAISGYMGSLLTGYAVYFNTRHQRSGYLFQNRFKSTLVEEEGYFLELVRYIHLNPVRAGLVADVAALATYPWSGHSRLMGEINDTWQDVDAVLVRFGRTADEAAIAYREFVMDGLRRGRRPDLQGGGLHRSHGVWEAQGAIPRGRESWAFDERILGRSDFVEAVLAQHAPAGSTKTNGPRAEALLPQLMERVADRVGIAPREIAGNRKSPELVAARSAISYIAVRHAGLPLAAVARALRISSPTVLRGVRAGRMALAEWGLSAEQLLR